jgi:hypothetical protein
MLAGVTGGCAGNSDALSADARQAFHVAAYGEADAKWRRALEVYRDRKDAAGAGRTLIDLARVARAQGRAVDAQQVAARRPAASSTSVSRPRALALHPVRPDAAAPTASAPGAPRGGSPGRRR